MFDQDQLNRQDRISLLTGSPSKDRPDDGRIVCSCFGVGVNTLAQAIREQGLTTPAAIGDVLKAGTNCGSCIPELRALIQKAGLPKVS